MTRVSVKEAYSNRDLIAQIVRLKTYVEQGTFKEVSTSYSGGVLVLTFTAYDDSTQSFSIPMDSIVGITGDQVGNVVTLHVEFASGTVVDIPYTIANADTSPTPDTLGLRDASGKLFAADPASGATDTSLVTANWVSQTGDSAPNNLVHRSGNETVTGIKTFEKNVVARGSSNTLAYVVKRTDIDAANPVDNKYTDLVFARDTNDTNLGWLQVQTFADGHVRMRLILRNSDGTLKYITLGESDVI